MTLKEVYTSFEGRIGRQTFWLSSILLLILVMFLGGIITLLFGTKVPIDQTMGMYQINYTFGFLGGTLMTLLTIFYVWANLAVAIKRWHDRNKSGWWIFMGFVPVIGQLWVLIETGFLKGTEGPNDYGPDPLQM
jgi:uncharacterized membrane protein YhaH (DUF805 family)